MRGDFLTERDKALLRLEYMNAVLHRVKKMPELKELMGENRPPTLAEIAQVLNDKPTFERKDHVKV